jgi:eukaryotic-like serine/threonine-protein kinase
VATSRWHEIEAQFDSLCDLEAEARAAALVALASRDPELASEVRAMLVADAALAGPLERGLQSVAAEELAAVAAVGDALPPPATGPWRMRERRGAGGMGEVWLAERADGAFAQRVAVKLLKRGMDSEELVARFQRERHILARLEHPAIARLLDGGTASDGRPYLVLEWVEGLPIAEYCAVRQLPVETVLELFLAVVEAVEFAHRRLVVHRDLKPSNILVDAAAAVKLLDFGIAKLLDSDDPDAGAAATRTGVRLLTPAYAAPEQLAGEPVSTATDIYALGVLLFELLAGVRPERGSGGVAPRPSSVAPPQRARRLAGDLDTIVQKALAPEPLRRYGSAEALAEDLRRHLQGRPVLARPDTAGYRLGKFVRRHRAGVAAAAVILLSLVGGLVAATRQARRADRQAARAELAKGFVLSLFGEQDPVTRAQAAARKPSELVAAGVERARRELSGDPPLQLEVLADLGALQVRLGDQRGGAEVLRELLAEIERREGREGVRYAALEGQYAATLADLGRVKEARPRAEHALQLLRSRLGGEDAATAAAAGHLAHVLMLDSAFEAALRHAREAHRATAVLRGGDHRESLAHLASVGLALEQMNRLDEATAVFTDVAERTERSLGPGHAAMVQPLRMLGDLLRRRQRYEEALPPLERSAELARQHLGATHPLAGGTLMRLGDLLRRLGRHDEAEQRLQEAAGCYAAESPQQAQIHAFRANLREAQGRLEEAAEEYWRAHRVFLASVGSDSVYTWGAAHQHSEILLELGRVAQAEPIAIEALARLEATAGPASYDVAMAAQTLGVLRRAQGRFQEALALHERALPILIAVYGEDHPNTAEIRFQVARDLRQIGTSEALMRAARELARVLAHLAPNTSMAAQREDIVRESDLVAQALANHSEPGVAP